MTDKVKTSLICNSIAISVISLICLGLMGLCERIPYEAIEITSKILIAAIGGIINLIILFFFFLYWWSEVKWMQIKRKFKKKK